MAEYAAHIGSRVEVHYRAGEMSLSATGILAADSGRSIFLEERLELEGSKKQFRWEIPYSSILRIVVNMPASAPAELQKSKPAPLPEEDTEAEEEKPFRPAGNSRLKPNILSSRRPLEN